MNSYIFSLFILLLPVSFVLSFSEMETKVSINADGQDDACFDENFGNIVVHEDSKIYPDAIMVQIKHRKWQYGITILSSSNDYVLEKDKRTVFHYYESPIDPRNLTLLFDGSQVHGAIRELEDFWASSTQLNSTQGRKYLFFLLSFPQNERKIYYFCSVSFVQFVYFLREVCLLFNFLMIKFTIMSKKHNF